LLNAGQTCIAADYVLLHEAAREPFVRAARDYVAQHYPGLRRSPDYASIVSAAHWRRLSDYLDEARSAGAQVIALPDEHQSDASARVLAPTLVLGAPEGTRVMQEEIFGPILPVVTYGNI